MRSFLYLVLSAKALLAVATAGQAPNILLILTDDHGWSQMSMKMDPRVDGSRSAYLETPHTARLMKEGMGRRVWRDCGMNGTGKLESNLPEHDE